MTWVVGQVVTADQLNNPVFNTVTGEIIAGFYDRAAYTSIQAAIDAADADGGGTVLQPSGEELITATVSFTNKTNVQWVGLSGAVVKAATGSNLTELVVSTTGAIDCEIRDITFHGNYRNQAIAAGTPVYGVKWTSAVRPVIRDCAFTQCGNLAAMDVGSVSLFLLACAGPTVTRNRFYSNWGQDCTVQGFGGVGSDGANVTDNTGGAAMVTEGNQGTDWWDTHSGGYYGLAVGGMTNAVVSRNRWFGGQALPSGTFASQNPIILTGLTNATMTDNLADGFSNGFGTISVTNGAAAVVGTNTFFSTAAIDAEPCIINAMLTIEGDTTVYRVATVTDTTHITLTPVVARATASGLRYRLSNTGDLFVVNDAQHFVLSDNTITNGHGNGLGIGTVAGAGSTQYGVVSGNTSSNCDGAPFNVSCLSTGTCAYVTIENNAFINGGGAAPRAPGFLDLIGGIMLDPGSPGGTITRLKIRNNLVADTRGAGAYQQWGYALNPYGHAGGDARMTLIEFFGDTVFGNVQGHTNNAALLTSNTLQAFTISGPLNIIGTGTATLRLSGAASNRLTIVAEDNSNMWNLDNTGGVLRAFRENFSATGAGAGGALMFSITNAGVATFASTVDAVGYKISGAATTGNVLRGNGTNFVSATLAAADLSNGTTGTGLVVLQTTPTLITPVLGAATGTSLVLSGALTADTVMVGTSTNPGTGIINVLTGFRIGNAAAVANVLRGDGINFVSTQLVITDLAVFASSSLANRVTDETGSGSLVFATSPTLVTPALGVATSTGITDTSATGIVTNAGTVSVRMVGSSGNGAFVGTTSNDYYQFQTNNSNRMRLHASGGLSLGNTTDPGATNLTVAGTINASGIYISNGTNGVTQAAAAVASLATIGGIVTTFTPVSDERLKDWAPYSRGLAEIRQLESIRYAWNATAVAHDPALANFGELYGWRAQNLQQIAPELVGVERWDDGREWLTLRSDRAIPAMLVNAVQELDARLTALERQCT